MKVGIYGPYFQILGGGELYLGTIAEALSTCHEVDIISEAEVPLQKMEDFFGLDLHRVKTRRIEPIPFVESLFSHRFFRYYHATEFTQEYDLFIVMPRNFRMPFRILSRKKILHLQVPDRPWKIKGPFWTGVRNEILKSLLYPRIYASFDAVLINSKFHACVIARRLHNPHAMVLHPPVSLKDAVLWPQKEKIILAVGRFFRGLHSKRQDILIEAFRKLSPVAPGWRLILAGGLSQEPSAREYFQELQERAAGFPVELFPNISLEQMNRLYGSASYFWHASGYEVPESRPELMEHFGIATVEAMSAGCIPIVYGAGGQEEIITHGVDGFFWRTQEDLIRITQQAIRNTSRMQGISEAAVLKSREFSKETFVKKLLHLIDSLMSNN